MSKIKVEPDESLLADYPQIWRARVVVVASAGTIEHEVTGVPGDPVWPFGREHARAKFLRFVLPVFGTGLAEHILEHCSEVLTSWPPKLLVGEIEAACVHRLPLNYFPAQN
jgi:2-methylcitrate dehydratase PrpD